ncbi:MAG: fibronectin type III domain-containing protein, partial [Gammaproteobacteria bacterium]|nr:fibronectin type III domain-containing protein [Gammaproteobacteria bacterium]
MLLLSAPVYAQTPPPPKAPAPTNLTVDGTGDGSVSLSWTAPADDGEGALTGYNMHRCTQVPGEAACTPVWIAWVNGGATTTYQDTGLTADETYRYAVGASRGAGTESDWSNQVTATVLPNPGAPTSLTVQAQQGVNVLNWTAPADDGSGTLDGYNVYRCEEGDSACTPTWIAWVNGAGTTTYRDQDSALTAGETYRYAVGASRNSQISVFSNQVTAQAAAATVPGAPTGLRGASSASKVELSWTAPTSDGGRSLSGYTLSRGSDCSSLTALSLSIAGDVTGVEDTDVTDGASYCYALSASNSVGAGASSATLEITAVNIGAPTGLTVTATSSTAVGLSWTAPANDDGGAVSGYNIYRCTQVPGEADCTPGWIAWVNGSTTSYSNDGSADGTDDDVAANATYRYAVQAQRAGLDSAWSNQVTAQAAAATVPGAPTGLRGASSASKVELSWTAPTSDGGRSLSGYTLSRGSDCSSLTALSLSIAGDVTGVEDTDVTDGASYCYALSASNSVGAGASSATLEITAVNIGAPTGLTVTATSSTAVGLSWTAPANDDGGAVSGYNIYRCNEGGSRCTPTWIHWVNGRTTSYRDDGTAVVDPDGEGGEPGAPIGFTSGANYRYAVLAQRAGVDSPWSNQVTTRQEAPRPSGGGGGGSGGSSEETRPVRPVGLTVTAVTTESISLRWQPSPNGEDGSVYDIYRCTVPDGASTCDPYNDLWLARLQDTNTYNDTEIVAGETYRYQVAAGRSSGRENLSGAITVATQTSPVATPAPTDLAVIDTGERSVSLSWTLPADDGRGPIQSIHIYRCDVERSPDCSEFLHAASRNPALTEYRDNDVEPATTYRYAVASYRSAQEASPWSNQVAASTQSPVPAAPTGLTVTATSETEIALSWTAPEGVVEAYNIFRCVQREQGCTPEWYKWLDGGRTTTFTDTDLTAGAEYRYAVEAIRYNRSTSPWSEWKSPWSDQVTATASAAPVIVQAPAPTELAVVSATDTAISLSWTAPDDDGQGALHGYNVYRCEEGESPCEPQWMAWVDGGNTTNYTDDGTADPDNDGTPIGLTTGATYRYAVGASRGQGTESPWSNQVTAQAGTVIVQAPAPTELAVVSATDTAISLSWTAPDDDGQGALHGYNVYRCEEGESPCEPQWMAWVDGGNTTNYTDDGTADPDNDGTPIGLTTGATYRYAVGASRGQGTESPWSDQVTATASAAPVIVQAPAPTELAVVSAT